MQSLTVPTFMVAGSWDLTKIKLHFVTVSDSIHANPTKLSCLSELIYKFNVGNETLALYLAVSL